jgi:hypothetical protein
MTALAWDQVGERLYETGVDKAVLFLPDGSGVYNQGFAWSGMVSVTESPSGAESNPQYADNIKYLNLLSLETFGGTIEAFTYPDEFQQCDGTATPQPGIAVGQQTRKTFGLCYRTRLGNDLEGVDHAYKLHIVYGALASPSERQYTTINDSPEAISFSWDFTTYPVQVGTVDSVVYKPTASLAIDSSKVDPTALAALEALLYGTVGSDPSLPPPADVITMLLASVTTVTPTAPTFNSGTHTITIPSVTGVTYFNNATDEPYTTGAHVIAVDTVVKAKPNPGYAFPAVVDDDWFFDFV